MIVVRMTGGLGNQMFQYAAGRRLALKHGVSLALDIFRFSEECPRQERSVRHFELGRFGIEAQRVLIRPRERRQMPRFSAGCCCTGMVHVAPRRNAKDVGYAAWFETIPPDAYLDGFWQSDGFFSPIADVIRREFQPVNPADLPPADWTMEARESVAIHVRRGDYIGKQFRLVSIQYLRNAMSLFEGRYGFAVFSDDPDWCRANLGGPNMRFMPMDDAVRDLYRMAACAHTITSNSTYSWWAGWLNPNLSKRVIAPWPWRETAQEDPHSMIPSDWTVLPI